MEVVLILPKRWLHIQLVGRLIRGLQTAFHCSKEALKSVCQLETAVARRSSRKRWNLILQREDLNGTYKL